MKYNFNTVVDINTILKKPDGTFDCTTCPFSKHDDYGDSTGICDFNFWQADDTQKCPLSEVKEK